MIDANLQFNSLAAFQPPLQIKPSDFVEAELRLSSIASVMPGPIRLAAYQRQLVDDIADPAADIVVHCLSAQVGKTLSISAQMAYVIACEPATCLHVSTTETTSANFVRDKFEPLIDSSPVLRRLVGQSERTRKGSSGAADSLNQKGFPSGAIRFGSSFKADDLAGTSNARLWCDELDRWNTVIPGEGDPVQVAIKRTTTYKNAGRKIVLVSTPTNFNSRIWSWYERGDKRKWNVTCPDCQHDAPLEFERLHWTEGDPSSVMLQCQECGALHDEAAKRKMVDGGRWVATATQAENIRSYQLNEIASAFSSMQNVVAQYEAADTVEKKQTFYNTVLALPYDSNIAFEVNASALQQRAIPMRVLPSDVVSIVAGCDVQANRIEILFLGIGRPGLKGEEPQRYIFGYQKIAGDTSSDFVWNDLDDALSRSFTTEDGRTLGVAYTGIDSGFNTDKVIRAVIAYQRKNRRTLALKGVPGFNRVIIEKSRAKLKKVLEFGLVGVDAVKLLIGKRLAAESVGPGYFHIADHFEQDVYEGFASERILAVKDKNGFTKLRFEKIVQRNESLDCLTYALAISTLLRPEPKVKQADKPKSSIAEQAAQLRALHNPSTEGHHV